MGHCQFEKDTAFLSFCVRSPFIMQHLLLLVVALLSLENAVPSAGSSESGIYSHSHCTVPALDEQPATHYRGTWGHRQFLEARTLQRVCVYSNVCAEVVQPADANSFSVNFTSFVPAPPSAEDDPSVPPQYLGFETFSHSFMDFEFDIVHHPVPNHYVWASDAGADVCFFVGRDIIL